MAFVGGRIPDSEKNKIDVEKIKAIRSYFIVSYLWAIDRERGMFLLPLGGGVGEKPSFFGLDVLGEIVVFEAVRLGSGNNNTGFILSYKISYLTIPKVLESRRQEIKGFIREALDAYGQYGDRSHVTSVSVEFENEMG